MDHILLVQPPAQIDELAPPGAEGAVGLGQRMRSLEQPPARRATPTTGLCGRITHDRLSLPFDLEVFDRAGAFVSAPVLAPSEADFEPAEDPAVSCSAVAAFL